MPLGPRVAEARQPAESAGCLPRGGGALGYAAASDADISGRTIILMILIAPHCAPLSVSYTEGNTIIPRSSEAGMGGKK